MIIPTWLTEIESRLENATPGPWELDEPTTQRWGVTARNIVDVNGRDVIHADDYYLDAGAENFALILNAPTDLRKLIEAVKVMKEALEFYGEKSNWVSRSGKMGVCPIDTEDRETLDHDSYKQEYPWAGGKKAREALAALEKLGDGK